MNEWRESTWGEEISLEYGKALRGYDTAHGKYRVFGSNGPIGWHSEYLTTGPGVILGRKGAYRGVEYWRDPFWVIDTAYYVVPNTELDPRWLYYAIKHYKLGEIDDGSPIPSTTRAAVYVKELQVPPLREQQAIACVLGALDDKIELNRRRNRTLDAGGDGAGDLPELVRRFRPSAGQGRGPPTRRAIAGDRRPLPRPLRRLPPRPHSRRVDNRNTRFAG
jgi:type I restriction enzyme, S subunit